MVLAGIMEDSAAALVDSLASLFASEAHILFAVAASLKLQLHCYQSCSV